MLDPNIFVDCKVGAVGGKSTLRLARHVAGSLQRLIEGHKFLGPT